MLTHASGHAAMVNGLALEMGGIDDATADPPGGEIVRDSTGRAIGILRETAEDLVAVPIRPSSGTRPRCGRMVELASGRESGATASPHSRTRARVFARPNSFGRWLHSGELPVRLWVMLSERQRVAGRRVAGLPRLPRGRRFSDRGRHQTLGRRRPRIARGLVLEPYTDLPRAPASTSSTPDELRESARLAAEYKSPALLARHRRSSEQGHSSTSTRKRSSRGPMGVSFGGEWSTPSTSSPG